MDKVKVRMFDSFEIEYRGKILNESANRSKKLWVLLAYIIYFRRNTITRKMLLEDLWGSEYIAENVLKIAMHRLRQMLSECFGEEFGHSFLVCKNNRYNVNESFQVICDFEEFDEEIIKAKKIKKAEERLVVFRKAFEQYRGEFLASFSDETWVIPMAMYSRSLYQELVQDILTIYEKQSKNREAVELLGKAIKVTRKEETFYVALLRLLLAMKEYSEAVHVYEYLAGVLQSSYEEPPSEEAKKMYYEAVRALNQTYLSIKDLPAVIREHDKEKEALYCEFDFFKVLCRAYLRATKRSGNKVCIVLVDITDLQERPLSKRSFECCVANLKKLLCANLRSEDAVSMCTPTQFVMLLQGAGKENAELVIERIKKLFYKQYPHTPAKLSCYVDDLK